MPPRTMQNSTELSKKIKARRKELGYTIDEAAMKAGVGTKTWTRYESGESIRLDKLPGILRTLRWKDLPTKNDSDRGLEPFSHVDPSHPAWSRYLEKEFGQLTASLFVVGYELIADYIDEAISELAVLPVKSHIGQLETLWLAEILPPQYLTRYDYEFLFALRNSLEKLRIQAEYGGQIVAHTVLEEIALYLIEKEAMLYLEAFDIDASFTDECPEGLVGELCDDCDVYTCLYDFPCVLESDHIYAFENWLKPQFYLDRH